MGKERRGRRKGRKRGRGEMGKGKGGGGEAMKEKRNGGVDVIGVVKGIEKGANETSNEQILVNPARSLLSTKLACKCTPNPQIEPKTTQHKTTIECTTQFSNNSFQRHKVATANAKKMRKNVDCLINPARSLLSTNPACKCANSN